MEEKIRVMCPLCLYSCEMERELLGTSIVCTICEGNYRARPMTTVADALTALSADAQVRQARALESQAKATWAVARWVCGLFIVTAASTGLLSAIYPNSSSIGLCSGVVLALFVSWILLVIDRFQGRKG